MAYTCEIFGPNHWCAADVCKFNGYEHWILLCVLCVFDWFRCTFSNTIECQYTFKSSGCLTSTFVTLLLSNMLGYLFFFFCATVLLEPVFGLFSVPVMLL